MVSTVVVELEPVAARLSAELAAAGYAVRFERTAPPAMCSLGFRGSSEPTWISLGTRPARTAGLVATVCSGGTTVVVAGPAADPIRFVVTTAEAVNGLTAAGRARPRSSAEPARERDRAPVRPPEPERGGRSFALSQTLIADPAGFPLLWGSSLELRLALAPRFGISIDGFIPLSRPLLSGQHADLRTALTMLRAGPVLSYSLAGFSVAASATVGPSLTWVSAEAEPPYIGGTDFALGAFSALGVRAAYPERGSIFAQVCGQASLLLPGPRFASPGDGERAWGPWFIEASLGLGLRF